MLINELTDRLGRLRIVDEAGQPRAGRAGARKSVAEHHR